MSFITRLILLFSLCGSSTTWALESHSFSINSINKQGVISKESMFTEKDFLQAKVTHPDGKTILEMTLTDAAAKVLSEYTSKHVGEKIALREANHVLAKPVLRAPIVGGKLQIDALSEKEANAIAKMIDPK